MEGGELIMQIALTLQHMFPNAVLCVDFDVEHTAGEEPKISKWNLEVPQPTVEEIQSHWTANEAAIMAANQPPKSELEILKETVDQLVLDNLMGGF